MLRHVLWRHLEDDEPPFVELDVSPEIFGLGQVLAALLVASAFAWLAHDWRVRRAAREAHEAKEQFWTRVAVANMLSLVLVTYVSFYVDSNVTSANTPDVEHRLPYITSAHRRLEELFVDRDAIRNDPTTKTMLTYTLLSTAAAISLVALVVLFPRFFWSYDPDDPDFRQVPYRRLSTNDKEMRWEAEHERGEDYYVPIRPFTPTDTAKLERTSYLPTTTATKEGRKHAGSPKSGMVDEKVEVEKEELESHHDHGRSASASGSNRERSRTIQPTRMVASKGQKGETGMRKDERRAWSEEGETSKSRHEHNT